MYCLVSMCVCVCANSLEAAADVHKEVHDDAELREQTVQVGGRLGDVLAAVRAAHRRRLRAHRQLRHHCGLCAHTQTTVRVPTAVYTEHTHTVH